MPYSPLPPESAKLDILTYLGGETLSKGEDYDEIACRVPVTGNGIFIRVRINHP
jgi:hypothetical protein